jgi:hypothetical protein
MTKLELYEVIKNDLGGAAAVVAPQVEKLANEILTYEFFSSAFWGVGSLVLLVVVLLVSMSIYSKLGDSRLNEGDRTATVVITLLISIFLLLLASGSFTAMIKIKTAPTYYLIEKAGRAISRGSK